MAKSKSKEETPKEPEISGQELLDDDGLMEDTVEALNGSSRIKRQKAASALRAAADLDSDALVEFMDDVIEAVDNPESQTRWECLNILCVLAKSGDLPGPEGLAAAEDALYDEKSGIVREAAFRFFCTYGATNTEASAEVWPYLDEAIQCHHGNNEFNDMLASLAEFAEGDISLETSKALAERMTFDAENAKGTLRMRSLQIIDAYKKREEDRS